MQQPRSKTIIFVGPSALGKTFAAEYLMRRYPTNFTQAKLYTTRAPRHKDEQTIDRIFVDRTTFQGMIESGKFLVHGEFGENFYGFTDSALIPDTKHIVVNAWPALIPDLVKLNPAPIIVGLQAPKDWQELLGERMTARGDSEETIKRRFVLIQNDIRLVAQYSDLIALAGKLFVVEGDNTIPEEVVPWILQKLGLPEPK